MEFAACRTDGDKLTDTSVIATVAGRAQALLMGERLALNLLQHLSGVATAAHRLSAIAAPFGARLVDTRKTTPGLRTLEKYAVRVGGAANHRRPPARAQRRRPSGRLERALSDAALSQGTSGASGSSFGFSP